jgi:hypothetical protein
MLENTEGAIKKWTIQRNWQHRIYKTKQKHSTTMHKQTQIK